MKSVHFASFVSLLCAAQISQSQIIGGSAYLIGEYIEIGVRDNGAEGTLDLAGSHSRGGSCVGSYLGMVANPQMDGWVNYDGDFFTPGTPENGFGLDIGGVEKGNNATSCATPLTEIPGTITDYWETVDSVEVTWQGSVSGIDVVVIYGLQKNELHYTTTVILANTTASPIPDVYYYRNIDPDHNQTLGWGFPTTNTIISQNPCVCDCVVVEAVQTMSWVAEYALEAFDDSMWRCSYGGFTNRDGSEIWNGTGFSSVLGSSGTGDVAISLARYIPSLPIGKSTPVMFDFRVRFGDGTWDPADPGPEGEPGDTIDTGQPGSNEGDIQPPGTGGGTSDLTKADEEATFVVFPNPNPGEFSIIGAGEFYYFISDQRGRVIIQGNAVDKTNVKLDVGAGTYFAKIQCNGHFKTIPIVVVAR